MLYILGVKQQNTEHLYVFMPNTKIAIMNPQVVLKADRKW